MQAFIKLTSLKQTGAQHNSALMTLHCTAMPAFLGDLVIECHELEQTIFFSFIKTR